MKLCDMHCDTAAELFTQGLCLGNNTLHISLDKAAVFRHYIQVAAIFSDYRLTDDESFKRFFEVADYFEKILPGSAAQCKSSDELVAAQGLSRPSFVYSVEDARLLGGDIRRLDCLYSRGVRILTLLWKGDTCIGGSHDTENPLTDFGVEVVKRSLELGIIPDVSHASRKVTSQVTDMARAAGKPVIASHSNSFSVCPHTRNLTDDEFSLIRDMGGIVGISLAPEHLTKSGHAGIDDVICHVEHYLSLGGEDTVCLGCDFDGISDTPAGLKDISSLTGLYDTLLRHGVSEKLCDKIFYENSFSFLSNNIK